MNLSEAKALLQEVRPYFYRYDEPVKTYIHWTGGDHKTVFGGYHFCITDDGDIVNTRDLRDIPAATYARNTGSIAISLCCAKDAMAYAGDPYHADLGNYPPTQAQIETCAQLMAAVSEIFGIPITLDHFLTHAEAADNLDGLYPCEPYGPDNGCERWDLAVTKDGDEWGDGGNVLRGKAIWYQKHGG